MILPASRSIRRALERALFWLLLALVLTAPITLLPVLDALQFLFVTIAEVPR